MCEDEADFMRDPKSTPLDQLKALGEPKRLRIMAALGVPRTVKQVGDYLGEDPSTLYYHVKELYRVGLVELVETRVVGGVAEKYYRAVEARSSDALQREATELADKDPEAFARMLGDALNSVLASILAEFSWFTSHLEEFKDQDFPVAIAEGFVDLTPDEADAIAKKLNKLVGKTAAKPRKGARRWCLASFLFPMRPEA